MTLLAFSDDLLPLHSGILAVPAGTLPPPPPSLSRNDLGIDS
jgi:hypothetical protein